MKTLITQNFLILTLSLLTAFTLNGQHVLTIQAEDGNYTGKTDDKHSGYTGDGFVDTENETGSYLTITFSIKEAGNTNVAIRYAHGKSDDRLARVLVNNEVALNSLSFPPTGAFTSWDICKTELNLNEGTNVVKLEALTSGGLANIDKIEIEGEQGPVQYQLQINSRGGGTIHVSPEGPYYNEGTTITLTARNNEQAEFDHWEGALSGNDLSQSFTITENTTVVAVFNKLKTFAYYCSPHGNDENGDGSAANPFFNIQKAVDLATEGDTIFLMGGIYSYDTRIEINSMGSENNYIVLRSIPGERAILDFSSMSDADANQGIRLTGSYWHFYGFDITGAGDNGLLIERNKPSGGSYEDVAKLTNQAHDNIIEFCHFYRNRDTGVQLKNLAAYNKIINCDSYFNRDSSDGDADGFAPKLTVGTGNYFFGCRAWQNSDDGWDGYLKCKDDNFPQDMVTTLENCWCWKNGFLEDGKESNGNGNGFKLGGSNDKDERHDFVLIRCLAFDNLQKGFDQNSNVGNMTLINCTGFATPYTSNSSHYTYRIDGSDLAPGRELLEINNIAICDGKKRQESAWAPCEMEGGKQFTCNYLISDEHFVTTNPVGVDAPRKSDGSLPDINFLHLTESSSLLIDEGTINENLQYKGHAPDLGCFESEYTGTGDKTTKMLENMASIYPNPASGKINIIFHTGISDGTLTLYNIHGKQITSRKINNNPTNGRMTINVSNLPRGNYLLQLKNRHNIQTNRITVTGATKNHTNQ